MFGVISLIISFFGVAHECGRVGAATVNNRQRAIENGDDCYYTGDHKLKHTQTNETVTHQYLGGHKLVGLKTGTVYRDYEDERVNQYIKEQNERLKNGNSHVFYKRCQKYWNSKFKTYSTCHLYEVSTGKPYKVLMPCVPGKWTNDESRFTIVYLDENNNMMPTSEVAYIPKEFYSEYLHG